MPVAVNENPPTRSEAGKRPPAGRTPQLVGLDLAAFPFHEVVRVERLSLEAAAERARNALRSQGFFPGEGHVGGVAPLDARPGAHGPSFLVGERNLRPDVTDVGTLVTLLVLLAGGAALGALDYVVSNNWLSIPAWVAGFGLFALLLWLTFGRTYQSDVIVVVVRRIPTPTSDAAGEGPVRLVWYAGRLRSDHRGVAIRGARRAVRVRAGYGIVGALASAVRTYREGIEASVGPAAA